MVSSVAGITTSGVERLQSEELEVKVEVDRQF
jgi:hypothetical protein